MRRVLPLVVRRAEEHRRSAIRLLEILWRPLVRRGDGPALHASQSIADPLKVGTHRHTY